MTSDLEFALVILSCEVTILTHTEMNTISADEACTDDGSHVTANTFIVIVSRKTVSQKRQLNAAVIMILTKDFLAVELVDLIVFTFTFVILEAHFENSGIVTAFTDVHVWTSFTFKSWATDWFTLANITFQVLVQNIFISRIV